MGVGGWGWVVCGVGGGGGAQGGDVSGWRAWRQAPLAGAPRPTARASAQLIGAHSRKRPGHHMRQEQARPGVPAAKVGERDAAARPHQRVFRLEVAVHDALAVQVGQGLRTGDKERAHMGW